MKTVTVHRAADIVGSTAVEPVTIVIGESIEEVSKATTAPGMAGLNQMANVFNYEADAIADALFASLPQAVAQRLALRLMQRQVGHYLGGPR